MNGRRGFTLLELMTASCILVLVVGGVFSAFVGIWSMTGTLVAEAELSVRMRELREKLLFHTAPPHDGCVWSGVLSGSDRGNVVEGGFKIKMDNAYGYDTENSRVVNQRIELVPVVSGEKAFFGNDGDRYDEHWETRWLDPGKIGWLPSEDRLMDDELGKRNVFYINLEASVKSSPHTVVTRRERVTVPVFGKIQRTLSGRVFDD